MRIINLGSLNIDYVYRVNEIVKPGETTAAISRDVFSGGKGLNQSVALGRAGADVYHAGLIGDDKAGLLQILSESGVDTHSIRTCTEQTGHAIIQVASDGQNSIIVYGGANKQITVDHITEVLNGFGKGDMLLLQNEISCTGEAIEIAANKGMSIAFNPSPFTQDILDMPLEKLDWIILNSTEGTNISGSQDPDEIIDKISATYENVKIVLTLGSEGSICFDGKTKYFQESYKVKAVDTTAAGDTFTGYFLACVAEGKGIREVLKIAGAAAAISVMSEGAAVSIPARDRVYEFIMPI